MARYIGSVCKLCRREGVKLFLKGERCFKPSCSLERRQKRPGQHGDLRKKPTEFSLQLRETQKVKRIAGMLERQFRRFFYKASRMKGLTGENLLIMLELRIDNVVRQLGFAPSVKAARQLVRHGQVLVNQRKVDIPSYLVKEGQEITLKEKGKKLLAVKEALEKKKERGVPPWLGLNADTFTGKILRLPTRDELSIDAKDRLIVEYYSR